MTRMREEILSLPEVTARQLDRHLAEYRDAGRAIRAMRPAVVATCARGSSDHAATYFSYVAQMLTGVPVASMPPSLGSILDAPLALGGVPVLAISQSGGSADLCRFMQAAGRAGARRFVLTNTPGSPLTQAADTVLDIGAGPERAVAATKSVIASMVALVAMASEWAEDARLLSSLRDLPPQIERSLSLDWSGACSGFGSLGAIFTVSRGAGLAAANEAALKLKETCGLHAQGFSAAEMIHGPLALAGDGHGALIFVPEGAAAASVREATLRLLSAGSRVWLVDGGTGCDGAVALPGVRASHGLLDPILQLAAFYSFVERLSVGLGRNPDAPTLLRKATSTL